MIRSLGVLTIGVMVTAVYSLYAVLLSYFSPQEEKIHQIARNWAAIGYASKKQGLLDEARAAYCQAVQVGNDYAGDAELGGWRAECNTGG